MMNLPINQREFEKIIEILKRTDQIQLYNKLWSYNFKLKYQSGENNLWIS